MSSTVNRFKENRLVNRIARGVTNTIDRAVPQDDGLFIFGSNAGHFYGDNSRYLYEWILENEPAVDPVWMTKSRQVYDRLRTEDKPVEMITSKSGISALLRADTGFFTHSTADIAPDTATVPDSIQLVNLRHGESVKNTHLCPSNPQLVSKKKREQSRRWRERDVSIASTSAFVSKMQKRCLGVSRDQPIVSGYPRHDPLWAGEDNCSSVTAREYIDLDPEAIGTVALYAPTWRQYAPLYGGGCSTDFFPFNGFDSEELHSMLEIQNTALLLRPHPHDLEKGAVRRYLEEIEQESPYVNIAGPDDLDDVYEILPVVDILITDYSSLYHDFLITDRPIILLPYDYDTFEKEVGFVYDYHEMAPGPRPTTWVEFKQSMADASSGADEYSGRRSNLRDLLYEHQDGRASERLATQFGDN